MDIIQRNLFRLLRSGTFGAQEQIEPMSAFKWGRLYQLAVMHDIIPFVYDGIIRCKGQFFVHLTDKQKKDEFQNYTAGAASHAIYLYCASAGLKTTVRAMLDNEEVEKAMKLGENERLLYIQTVGR